MRSRQLLGIFLGFLSCLLVTAVSNAQCSKDTDCKGERVCEQGNCVTASAALPAPPVDGVVGTSAPAATPFSGPRAEVPIGATVAPESSPDKPRMERHSTGMMAGGIVMVSFVPIALLVSLVANLQQSVCEHTTYSYDVNGISSTYGNCGRFDTTIYGGLLSAGVLAGVGIPLIVIGAKKEPVGLAQLSPWATPQGAGLRLRVDL